MISLCIMTGMSQKGFHTVDGCDGQRGKEFITDALFTFEFHNDAVIVYTHHDIGSTTFNFVLFPALQMEGGTAVALLCPVTLTTRESGGVEHSACTYLWKTLL
jgi:hypothetical protein